MHVIYIDCFVIFSTLNYFKDKSHSFLNLSGIISIINAVLKLHPVDKAVEYVNNWMYSSVYCVRNEEMLQNVVFNYRVFHRNSENYK